MTYWISAEERLPETSDRYLTREIYELGGQRVGILWYQPGRGFVDGLDSSQSHTVTHWMPLPEPPKTTTKKQTDLLAARKIVAREMSKIEGLPEFADFLSQCVLADPRYNGLARTLVLIDEALQAEQ